MVGARHRKTALAGLAVPGDKKARERGYRKSLANYPSCDVSSLEAILHCTLADFHLVHVLEYMLKHDLPRILGHAIRHVVDHDWALTIRVRRADAIVLLYVSFHFI